MPPGTRHHRRRRVGVETAAEGAGQQHLRPVADIAADFRLGKRRPSKFAQNFVHGRTKVGDTVDEGAVQIEQHRAPAVAHQPVASPSRVRIAPITAP